MPEFSMKIKKYSLPICDYREFNRTFDGVLNAKSTFYKKKKQ